MRCRASRAGWSRRLWRLDVIESVDNLFRRGPLVRLNTGGRSQGSYHTGSLSQDQKRLMEPYRIPHSSEVQ